MCCVRERGGERGEREEERKKGEKFSTTDEVRNKS